MSETVPDSENYVLSKEEWTEALNRVADKFRKELLAEAPTQAPYQTFQHIGNYVNDAEKQSEVVRGTSTSNYPSGAEIREIFGSVLAIVKVGIFLSEWLEKQGLDFNPVRGKSEQEGLAIVRKLIEERVAGAVEAKQLAPEQASTFLSDEQAVTLFVRRYHARLASRR